MLVDSGTLGIGSSVTGAIRQASAATGTSFSYLLATAQVESGLDPRAGASTSSARGLFQFVEQTWLGTMKQSGAALGYGRFADAITRTPSGHFEVKDPAMRSEILKLRNDPTANAVMAGAFTQANAAYLAQKLGRPPTEGELYIAHFLGAGGAGKLISLAASNPNANAAASFPGAAQANRSIFYDRRTGTPRSLAEVRDALTGRYDVARTHPLAPGGTAEAANVPPPMPLMPTPLTPTTVPTSAPLSIVPDTAGITSAYAAAAPAAVPASAPHYYPMFHGLFADSGAPTASAVSQLWTTPSVPPETAAAPNVTAAAASPPAAPFGSSLLDLFRDPVRGS
jgi:Transglycosylase SLT domain